MAVPWGRICNSAPQYLPVTSTARFHTAALYRYVCPHRHDRLCSLALSTETALCSLPPLQPHLQRQRSLHPLVVLSWKTGPVLPCPPVCLVHITPPQPLPVRPRPPVSWPRRQRSLRLRLLFIFSLWGLVRKGIPMVARATTLTEMTSSVVVPWLVSTQ